MARKNIKAKRQQIKARLNRRKERQDDAGLSREKVINKFDFKLFFILKLIAIISIPVFYFIYSPLIIISLSSFIVLFFISFRVEKTINRSIIKSNHIHFPKIDSALALVVIVISIMGVCLRFTSTTRQSGAFRRRQSVFVTMAENLGSALTGTRTLIGYTRRFTFSIKGAPDRFFSSKEDFSNMIGNFDKMPNGFPDGAPPSDFDMKQFGEGFATRFESGRYQISIDDLPIEYMFSSILSSVNTVLVFATSVIGAVSLWYTVRKKGISIKI